MAQINSFVINKMANNRSKYSQTGAAGGSVNRADNSAAVTQQLGSMIRTAAQAVIAMYGA